MNEATESMQESGNGLDLSSLTEEQLLSLTSEDGEGDPAEDVSPEPPTESSPDLEVTAADLDFDKVAAAYENMYDYLGRVHAHAYYDELGKLLDGQTKIASISGEEVPRSLFVQGLHLLIGGSEDE
jgi:hypothetical protein